MSDDEDRFEPDADELAERCRLTSTNRSGSTPTAKAIAATVKVRTVAIDDDKRSCSSCGCAMRALRHHVECAKCEGDRNRKNHDATTKAIQAYKAHPTQGNWNQVRDLCGAGYADGLRTAMNSKGTATARPRREEF